MSDTTNDTMTDSLSHLLSFWIAFDNILAAVLSVALNHSTGWGIFHFLCGWFYLLYALLARPLEILPALHKMFVG